MQRSVLGLGMVLLLSASAFAAGRSSAERGIVLEGEAKMRYIAQQLSLDDKQTKDMESLLAVYAVAMKEESTQAALIARLNEIQIKVVDMKEAQAAGDMKKAEAIKDEIRKLTPGTEPEREFFENLSSGLNDGQKKKLESVRKRIENNPDVSLAAIDVIQTAQGMDLDAGQREHLDKLLADFRNDMATNRPATLVDRVGRVDDLASKVRGILKPDQAAKFDAEIKRLRPPMPEDTLSTGSQPSHGGTKVRVSRGVATPVNTDDPNRRAESITLEPVQDVPQPPPGGPTTQPAKP